MSWDQGVYDGGDRMNSRGNGSWKGNDIGSYCGPGYAAKTKKTLLGQNGTEPQTNPYSELFRFGIDLLMSSPPMKFTKWCAKRYLEENPDAIEEWLKEEGIEASEEEMMKKYGYLREAVSGTDTHHGDSGNLV